MLLYCGTNTDTYTAVSKAICASGMSKQEYGIGSFVYRRRQPFHPGRLHRLVTDHLQLREVPWQGDVEDSGDDSDDSESEGACALYINSIRPRFRGLIRFCKLALLHRLPFSCSHGSVRACTIMYQADSAPP